MFLLTIFCVYDLNAVSTDFLNFEEIIADPSITTNQTFYILNDLLKRLHNFACWDRHKIQATINIVLEDGLKEKILEM